MEKFKIFSLILICILLSGCYIYGQGRTIGYVTTIEAGNIEPFFAWDTVWFRVETGTMSSMQSQPEQYAILRSNEELKEKLLKTMKTHQKIELIYQKHLVTAHHGSNDEVIGFNPVE